MSFFNLVLLFQQFSITNALKLVDDKLKQHDIPRELVELLKRNWAKLKRGKAEAFLAQK